VPRCGIAVTLSSIQGQPSGPASCLFCALTRMRAETCKPTTRKRKRVRCAR
jgi:hypothetical protein